MYTHALYSPCVIGLLSTTILLQFFPFLKRVYFALAPSVYVVTHRKLMTSPSSHEHESNSSVILDSLLCPTLPVQVLSQSCPFCYDITASRSPPLRELPRSTSDLLAAFAGRGMSSLFTSTTPVLLPMAAGYF